MEAGHSVKRSRGITRAGRPRARIVRAGEQYRSYVFNWLAAAKRLGLEPVIAFTAATAGIDGPVPAGAGLDQRKYYCAVYWTEWAAAHWGTPVRYLEAWNEPDVNGYR